MPTSQPKAGVVELTSTTGTGPYELDGPSGDSVWRGFVASDDGKVFGYGVYQDGGGFEEGEGTYDHDARTLSRTTILGNHLNTLDPVDWGDGLKEVSNVILASRVMQTSAENKMLADQYLEAFRQYLDADRDSYFEAATDDVFKLFLQAIQVLEVSGGLGNLTLIGSDDGATEGPVITMRRDSASPAASDVLGAIYYQGRDSAGALQSAFRLRTSWTAVNSGSHASQASLAIAKAGALQIILTLIPDALLLPTGVSLYTAGKSAGSIGTAGTEIRDNGVLVAVTNSLTAMYCCRNGSDGDLMAFVRDGSTVALVSAAAGVVTYGTFTGGHWSEWAPAQEGDEQLGTVVATAEGLLEHDTDQLPLIRPATAGDPAVYGVIAGRLPTMLGRREGESPRSLLMVHGLGLGKIRCTGPIQRGDLLRVSAIPGVAEALPPETPLTAGIFATIAAKATQSSEDTGEIRLVPCVLMAG